MTGLSPERIAELRKLHAAATPGPWKCSRPDMLSYNAATGEQNSFVYRGDDARRIAVEADNPVEDAAWIAAACNEFPGTLDEIERLWAQVEKMRAALIFIEKEVRYSWYGLSSLTAENVHLKASEALR
jgi:hypothetical protein